MRRDKRAQITIRDMHKTSKAELREVLAWMRRVTRDLERQTAVGKPWLVTRRQYSNLMNWSLMDPRCDDR